MQQRKKLMLLEMLKYEKQKVETILLTKDLKISMLYRLGNFNVYLVKNKRYSAEASYKNYFKGIQLFSMRK